MRIAGGAFRGKRLDTPKGQDIRPTSDKVRQAIFNMLESRGAVRDGNVIDAFCGSGALGLEALSRGAQHCLFIDKSPQSLVLTKSNVQHCDARDRAAFLKQDSTKIPSKTAQHEAADLIFLDPPYRQDMVVKVIAALCDGGWVNDDALWVIEIGAREDCALLPSLEILNDKKYGDTRVILAQSTPE